MQTAKIFPNGRCQLIRLPEEFRLDSDEVYLARMGSSVVLIPKADSWNLLFDSLEEFSDDFMENRHQLIQKDRKSPFA
jgi:antitoxin VapB